MSIEEMKAVDVRTVDPESLVCHMYCVNENAG